MILRLLRLGATLALLALLGGWALLLRPVSLGGPALYLVVRGDSMLPTYETGDLVILRTATSYRAGEVVAYRVPTGELGAGRIVIHRIVGGDGTTGFVVKGDHNPAVDPWQPRLAEVVGTAWVAIPGFGAWIAWLHQPIVLAALAASLMAGFLIWTGGGPPVASGEAMGRQSWAARGRLPVEPRGDSVRTG